MFLPSDDDDYTDSDRQDDSSNGWSFDMDQDINSPEELDDYDAHTTTPVCMYCGDRGMWTPHCPYVAVWVGDTQSAQEREAPPVGALVAVIPTQDATESIVVDIAISEHRQLPGGQRCTAITMWNTARLAVLIRRRRSAPCIGREPRVITEWVTSVCIATLQRREAPPIP